MSNLTAVVVAAGTFILLLIWSFGTHWVYLCRVSLIGLAGLTGLTLFARFSETGKSLALGAHDLQGFWDGLWVGLFLLFVIWAICVTSETVLKLGKRRLGQSISGSQIAADVTRYGGVALMIASNFIAVVFSSTGRRIPVGIGFWIGLGIG